MEGSGFTVDQLEVSQERENKDIHISKLINKQKNK